MSRSWRNVLERKQNTTLVTLNLAPGREKAIFYWGIYAKIEHDRVTNMVLVDQEKVFDRITCERYGTEISIRKTKTMAVCREPEVLEIDIKGTTLKQTKVFKYLGSLFTENGRLDREIGIFCQKANVTNYPHYSSIEIFLWVRKSIAVIKAIFLSTLT